MVSNKATLDASHAICNAYALFFFLYFLGNIINVSKIRSPGFKYQSPGFFLENPQIFRQPRLEGLQSREAYVDCLNEVDSLLSRLPSNDPIVVMGDLNCHLSRLGGSRSTEEPNHRGILWKELLDRHSLFVASLDALSTGPIHTYSSGDHSTTLDYVIGIVALAEMLQSCEILDDNP